MRRQDSVPFKEELVQVELKGFLGNLPTYKRVHLPDEICYKIVKLNEGRTGVLAALSLVSRQWNLVASSFLWKSPSPSTLARMITFKKILGKSKKGLLNSISGVFGLPLQRNTNLVHIKEIALGGYEWSNEPTSTIGSLVFQSGGLASLSSYYLRLRFWCRLSKNLGLSCPNLTTLDLSNCGMWLIDSTLLTICSNLRRTITCISLANCYKITDSAIIKLVSLIPKLKSINLSNLLNTTDEAIVAIAHSARQRLVFLDVTGCSISNAGLEAIAKYCTSLVCIYMENCFMISDSSLAKFLSSCKQLEHLKLPFFLHPQTIPSIENPVMAALLNNGPVNLKSLGLYMCTVDLDQFLDRIIQRNRNLIELNLSGCRRITTLKLSYLNKLTHLELGANNSVNDEFIKSLSVYAKNLKVLDLSHCRVSTLAVSYLFENCNALDWLALSFTCRVIFGELKVSCLSLKTLLLCQSPWLAIV